MLHLGPTRHHPKNSRSSVLTTSQPRDGINLRRRRAYRTTVGHICPEWIGTSFSSAVVVANGRKAPIQKANGVAETHKVVLADPVYNGNRSARSLAEVARTLGTPVAIVIP